ncbi:MAG: SUMF1/EgtB/PvdO family nonheme iron enzyme [Akkermansiaceae bacterium]|nr:SUMF1/EgtB/PvdO family nonheme iron enzyme [Akkermansiaceae bacterium]
MKTLLFPITLWLAIASLVFPLNAQSVSKLELEKSSALNVWEKVTITPEMVSSTGELLVPTSGSQEFYRMKVRLLASPSISNPPPATTGIEAGESVTFTVDSQGEGLTYQWYLGLSGDDSQAIQDATSQTYNTGALAADTSYWVKVTNVVGSINSETATVTINRPPTIASQPASQTILPSSTATLTVSATGSAPFTYQWYRGNLGATTAPVGTNSPTFTTPALTVTTKYWVKISNAFGEIQSSSVTVTVQANTAPTISDIAAQSITVGSNTGALAFTVGDAQTAASSLTLSASSSNTTLVPIASIVFGGSGASRTVTVTPASGQAGSATITVTVSDGSLTANDTFVLTVVNAPAAPTGFFLIPAGSFTMGDALDGGGDAHTVNVSAFYMAKNLVTKADWDTVRTWAISNGYSDLAVGAGKASNHPVQTVTWWDGVKYCNARSQQEGLTPVYTVSGAVMKTGSTAPVVNWAANGYRLPTEAEWEKAARGGLSGKRFPWGDTISQTQANYYAYSGYSYDLSGAVSNYHPTYATGSQPYTSPVGSFAANGYGLNDMAGNVYQWCWDWYGSYDTSSPTDPRGVSSGAYRVFRGGGWHYYANDCRVANRNRSAPSLTFYDFGFRVARSSVP